MKTLTFQLDQACSVQIDTISSAINVVGWHETQVTVEVPGDESCRVEQAEGRLRINALMLADSNLTVTVPSTCKLTVGTVSGDIACRQLAGTISLATTSGDVTAQQVAGHLHLRTVSGEGFVSGDEIRDLAVETVSGDITFGAGLEQDGNYSLHTISGDIHLRLPADERCLVLYRTLSGDLICTLPHQVRHQGWGKSEAVVNDGGVAVRCSSTSGDLTIQALEATAGDNAESPTSLRTPTPTKPLAEPFKLDEASPPTAAKAGYTTRLEVLDAIEKGRISVAEGLELLQKIR